MMERTYAKITNLTIKERTIGCDGGLSIYGIDYDLIRVDENSNESVEHKWQFCKIPWFISPCNGEDCCNTHVIQETKKFVYDNDTDSLEECVDGKEYNKEDVLEVMFSIKMLADTEHKCYSGCTNEEREYYCVNKDSVKVLYNTSKNVWSEDGSVPSSGGEVLVLFEYTKSIPKQEEGKITSVINTYTETISIPPRNCEDDNYEYLSGEIEFKEGQAQFEGCNVFEYYVKQDFCQNKQQEEKK